MDLWIIKIYELSLSLLLLQHVPFSPPYGTEQYVTFDKVRRQHSLSSALYRKVAVIWSDDNFAQVINDLDWLRI